MTQTPAPPRRFRYGDHVFADPDPAIPTAQVLRHLQAHFPELGHARVDETTLPDGTREIRFSQQVAHKG